MGAVGDVKFKAGKTSSAAVSKQVALPEQRKKSLGKGKLRRGNKGSLELMHVAQRRPPSTKMRKTQSHFNDEAETLSRRQMTGTHTQPLSKDKKEDLSLPSLQKIKSSKLFMKGASGTWPRAL